MPLPFVGQATHGGGGGGAALSGDAEVWRYADYATAIAAGDSWSDGDFVVTDDGLVPAIAQDVENGEVLMMAWMNADTLRETLETGRACYWSRSRQAFWRKGDTSGHHQTVHDLRIDCDGDTILMKITQVGAACHTGERTCFFTSVNEL